MDGSLLIPWSAVSSRYQHAACCVKYRLAVAIIMASFQCENLEDWQNWINLFKKFCFSCTRRLSWLRHCFTYWKVAGRFPIVLLEFFFDIILPTALEPWDRLSLRQKWVPEIYPGVKGGLCVGITTLPLSSIDCLEIWDAQTHGILRSCNRTVSGLFAKCVKRIKLLLTKSPHYVLNYVESKWRSFKTFECWQRKERRFSLFSNNNDS